MERSNNGLDSFPDVRRWQSEITPLSVRRGLEVPVTHLAQQPAGGWLVLGARCRHKRRGCGKASVAWMARSGTVQRRRRASRSHQVSTRVSSVRQAERAVSESVTVIVKRQGQERLEGKCQAGRTSASKTASEDGAGTDGRRAGPGISMAVSMAMRWC
ncbi:hypothetical protein BC567DRAFT_253430 [Phyllosticta citribraziliensis]